MKISNCFEAQSCICTPRTVVVNRDGRVLEKDTDIVKEHFLSVYIDEVLSMELVCTPAMMPELVLGRLVTEGMISSIKEVKHLYICEQGTCCQVSLCTDLRASESSPKSESSGCVDTFIWKSEWVFALADIFAQGTPIYRITHGVHSCMLAVKDQPVYCCEDLGRHNALDKVVGCACRDGMDLRQTILYTSGRVPTDIMLKAIRSQIPMIISNAAPTDNAVELAKKYGVTLICSTRPGHFLVFAGIENSFSDCEVQVHD